MSLTSLIDWELRFKHKHMNKYIDRKMQVDGSRLTIRLMNFQEFFTLFVAFFVVYISLS